MKQYRYVTSCIEANGDDINEMRRHPKCRAISYATMSHQCAALLDWAIDKGYHYAPGPTRHLTLANDHHVAYYSSYYQGKRCYFLVWSAIEYVWVKQDDAAAAAEARARNAAGRGQEALPEQRMWHRLPVHPLSR